MIARILASSPRDSGERIEVRGLALRPERTLTLTLSLGKGEGNGIFQ